MTVVDLLYLSRSDVKAVGLDFETGVDLVKESLLESLAGRVELPPKPGVHPRPQAFIHAMPVFAQGRDLAGVKWIAGYPDNPAQGLPYITGLVVLSDAATGLPTAIIDGEEITAVRTACVSGLAAKTLAATPVETIAMIGCGRQGRAHLGMIESLFADVAEVRLFDVVDAAATAAQEQFGARLPTRVVDSVEAAVDGAGVVLTAIAERDEESDLSIKADWLAEGALGLPLANDFGWSREALESFDRFLTDDRQQFESFRERGELNRCGNIGDVQEFAGVLVAPDSGRSDDKQRICCVNLGLAVHDIVLASEIERAARDRGIGTVLSR